MTMVRPASGVTPPHTARSVPPFPPGPGQPEQGRVSRRRQELKRRRLMREKALVVIFLVAALAATLVLLGRQWMDTGGPNPGGGVVIPSPQPTSPLGR